MCGVPDSLATPLENDRIEDEKENEEAEEAAVHDAQEEESRGRALGTIAVVVLVPIRGGTTVVGKGRGEAVGEGESQAGGVGCDKTAPLPWDG